MDSGYVCLDVHRGKYPFICSKPKGHEGRHGAVRFADGSFKYEWSDDGEE